MEIKKAMTLAIEEAKKTMNDDIGGPFGAAIISPEGKIVAVASNAVLDSHDPTAHAEISVIRKATTHDSKSRSFWIHPNYNSLSLPNVFRCHYVGKYQGSLLWMQSRRCSIHRISR
jgi:tRNA(Arg) A34 adenosine deaminase TadA